MDSLRSERLDRDRRRECGIDASRQADHDLPEAVLANVVAEAEAEREPHLLELVEWFREGGARAPVERWEWRKGDLCHRERFPVAREGPAAHVPKAAPNDADRVDVHHEEGFLEARRASDHLSVVVEDDGASIEEELILSADGVAERDEAGAVARTDAEHLLALLCLSDMERRGRDVDDELGSGKGEIGGGRARLPDVLADRQPDGGLAESEHCQVASGREGSVLVEHAVVREEALAVDR